MSIDMALPHIRVITTGGTIAGAGAHGSDSGYASGVLSAHDLLSSVPDLARIARISTESPFSKDSADILASDWVTLVSVVEQACHDDTVDGIVITHGTDTMEETAWLLQLVLPVGKPVVITGAMRAATSFSADGPLNLFNAVAVAAHPRAGMRGVLVVMNDTVFSASSVSKQHTTAVQAFASQHEGPVGYVSMGQLSWCSPPAAPVLSGTFCGVIHPATTWPAVIILYLHAAMGSDAVHQHFEARGLDGVVLAGLGNGNIPSSVFPSLVHAYDAGIPVVRASRIGKGAVTPDYNTLDSRFGTLCAAHLAPVQARILLALAIVRHGRNDAHIRAVFNQLS